MTMMILIAKREQQQQQQHQENIRGEEDNLPVTTSLHDGSAIFRNSSVNVFRMYYSEHNEGRE